ncbi:hypothetical protein Fmac_020688 [Flemingia macrophylla]|uniref:Pentatricopeptide repeat-containing protein n=1 Tax=Flemingia macrophylla TaxID=520843 RepID=A0ABD1LUY1_9FABA
MDKKKQKLKMFRVLRLTQKRQLGSGATKELLRLVLCAKAKGALLIALTVEQGNTFAAVCNMVVCLLLQRNLCLINLAPITSTAFQMVFSDNVAMTLIEAQNFTKEEYIVNRPQVRLGRVNLKGLNILIKGLYSCGKVDAAFRVLEEFRDLV